MLTAFLGSSATPSCPLWDPNTNFLKKPKPVLLNSRGCTLLLQDPELHYFMVNAVKTTHITTSPTSSSILGNSRSSCASPLLCPSVFLYQEVVPDTLQKSRLLVSCSVGPPARVRMFIKVPHRNHRPWSQDFFAFKESSVHILILRRVVCNRLIRVVPLPSLSSDPDPQTLILSYFVPHK